MRTRNWNGLWSRVRRASTQSRRQAASLVASSAAFHPRPSTHHPRPNSSSSARGCLSSVVGWVEVHSLVALPVEEGAVARTGAIGLQTLDLGSPKPRDAGHGPVENVTPNRNVQP